MNSLRPELPALPKRMHALPVDDRGYPVPWFVAWIDGRPEFRCVGPGKLEQAVKQHKCWICGVPISREMTFVIGPMCCVNRVSVEPASHAECAIFAAQGCPFLSRPHMTRRTNDMPEGTNEGAGFMIRRNPGVTCLWTTRSYELIREPNGVLFRIGDPLKVRWFAEGRQATRAEVQASIDSGLPILWEKAQMESARAVELLQRMHRAALQLMPAESAAPTSTPK